MKRETVTVNQVNRAARALLARARAIARWQLECKSTSLCVVAGVYSENRVTLNYGRVDSCKSGPHQLCLPRDVDATETSVAAAVRAWAKEQRKAAKDAEQLSLLQDQEAAAPAEGG